MPYATTSDDLPNIQPVVFGNVFARFVQAKNALVRLELLVHASLELVGHVEDSIHGLLSYYAHEPALSPSLAFWQEILYTQSPT